MSVLDWTLVIGLNGAIICYGLFIGRETKVSSDWFLASRRLPWWIVGLSLYATAIDSSDMVADSGGTYTLGISYFVNSWVGTVIGWFIAANFIVLPMYRAGMYTNAEYLEARFGPSTRLISALVQVQYRTLVLGNITTTIYLTTSVVFGWEASAWWLVFLIALLATAYTAVGGLRSVAVTDALQAVVMFTASLVFFGIAWSHVGGWEGIETKLAASDKTLPAKVLHVGHEHTQVTDVSQNSPDQIAQRLLLGGEHDQQTKTIRQSTPAWLFCTQFIIAGIAFSIVNHTQSMRLLGSKTEWDLKMSVVLAGLILIVVTFFNLIMGIIGRALYPELQSLPVEQALQANADAIYPILVRDLTGFGLKGLVVAGILAAAFSTYDSIGSTLSALLTRDVYARFFVPDREDHHYLRVGQWLTPVIIFGSFLYVPFLLKRGMVVFYLDLVSAFVVPLLTIYLMGFFTKVHRRSGTIGLSCGVIYGIVRMLTPVCVEHFNVSFLPAIMLNEAASYIWSMVITAGTMFVYSLFAGWETEHKLRHLERAGWLRNSQLEVTHITSDPEPAFTKLPFLLGIAVVLLGMYLSFVVFW